MRSQSIAFLVALTLAMSGCVADAPHDPATTPSTNQTAPTSSTTNGSKGSPAETAKYVAATKDAPARNVPVPNIPDVAKKANEKAAASFVSYYFDAINYAVESNDSAPLKKATSRECQICGETLIDPADRANKNGTWRVGGMHHAKIIDSYMSAKNRAVVTVSFTSDSGYLCNEAREKPEPFTAVETTIASIGLEYDKGWKVYTALFDSE